MKLFHQLKIYLILCATFLMGLAQAQIQLGNDIDGEASGDHFGWSVSMPDMNTVAKGARLNDGNGIDAGPQGQQSETSALRSIDVRGYAMLFPNLNAGGEVRVNLDGLTEGSHGVMISVYDIYGKQISTEGFGHQGNSLSRLVRFDSDLAMGMDMVEIVVDGDRFATERLVVK